MPGRHSGAPFPQRSTRTRTRTTPARTRQPASELPGGPATSAAPVSPHGGPGRLHVYGAAAVPPGPSVARTVRDVRACAGPLRTVELGRRLARAGSSWPPGPAAAPPMPAPMPAPTGSRRKCAPPMKIGILTSGGDCPGLNAVIRGAVIKGDKLFEDEFIGYKDGWRGVIDSDYMTLPRRRVRGIGRIGGTILGTSRSNPFADGEDRSEERRVGQERRAHESEQQKE